MKTLLLLAAVALASPTASFADHYRSNSCGNSYGGYHHYSHGYAPSYRPYGYSPYGYYAPGPVVSFNFGSRPSVYSATRYYVPGESSLESSVQRALRREGYYSGPVDGDIGPRSRSAIRDYQADHGLSATGRIDSRLLRSLGI
ncbi:MAG: peptidoglycan-binding domain-containing protein [Chthoniobacteraceae bacterium]